MFGLKSYLPVLAGHLNTTSDLLYERQRKLTAAGLLIGAAGRGPGSGIRAVPPVLTLIVLAVMATDVLGEVVARVELLASKASDTRRCPLTGASSFAGALELVLASEALASTVHHVTVLRSTLEGQIMYRPKGRRSFETSSFGRERSANRRGMQALLTIPGENIRAISKELSEMSAGRRIDIGERR